MTQARLRAIQLDPSTYCDEPEGDSEEYKKWLDSFVLDSKKGDISELLVINVDVRSLYTQLVSFLVLVLDFITIFRQMYVSKRHVEMLCMKYIFQVPSEVSHANFWSRYFYKLHQLDQDEARKAALMKRADVVQEQLDLEWEDGE